MTLPIPNLTPPFHIVRVAYADLAITDMGYSREYYHDIVGYHMEYESADVMYLRGMEERNHHSLVLRKADKPIVNALGFRVRTEEDLDKAHAFYSGQGLPAEWVERAGQGRTLKVRDPFGIPFEFYAQMDFVDDILQQYGKYHGSRVQRIDHVNLFHNDVNAATKYYANLGFQMTEATIGDINDHSSDIWASWMHRKGGVHDIAFTNGRGPRLHHIGIWNPSMMDIIHLCDTLATTGHSYALERGPGRHGISNAFFLYIRDRDGHRFEPFACDFLTMDPDLPPRLWDLRDPQRQTLWGQAAPKSWFELGSMFDGLEPTDSQLFADKAPIIAPE
ncbi:MAG: 3,4-dihydroxyphenylacetate 2,3-dioxygenase [Anaerolineae bacterium]